jgi:N-formylglutamate deformylase
MIFKVHSSQSPVLINIPHAGTEIPAAIEQCLTPAGLQRADTDWHVDRLVEFAPSTGAGLMSARYSRYVIDLNRSPDDQPLYQQPGSGLVPTESFSGQPLYRPGLNPDQNQLRDRLERYWQPYHDQLEKALESLRREHGYAVLLDAHSIASEVPRLFDGQLPDLNLGTFDSASCAPELESLVSDWLEQASGFTKVINGRFKGGYITRHYGRPDRNVHALQLEISQQCYMDQSRPEYWDARRAEPLIDQLRELVTRLINWRPSES